MKVLFDQCTPEPLREALPEHDVQTADEAGMGELKNGKLIDEAVRRGYDLLVTADRRMQKQQEIEGKPLRVVVLTRPDWPKAKKQIKEIQQAIATAEPGQFTRVIAPKRSRNRRRGWRNARMGFSTSPKGSGTEDEAERCSRE